VPTIRSRGHGLGRLCSASRWRRREARAPERLQCAEGGAAGGGSGEVVMAFAPSLFGLERLWRKTVNKATLHFHGGRLYQRGQIQEYKVRLEMQQRKRKKLGPMVVTMIRGYQIRAGRALIGMTATRLAKEASISATGLSAIESGASDPKSKTLDRLVRALEAEGVVFVDEDSALGPGVRLKKESKQ
jgi:DNA-binding XRE family transcriptional regulator